MPAGDRTGPAGAGPMTGRAAGFCTGNNAPGYTNSYRGGGGYGYGRGGRGGGGRGWRNRFYATGRPFWGREYAPYGGYGYPPYQQELTADAEIRMLKDQADFMQKEMATITERIRELESISAEKKEKA